jgi:colicin import membrane protein
MPVRLPPRPAKQTPASAQARAIEAKKREDHLRKQTQGLAARAIADQQRARAKQSEIERLKKCVVDCAQAYARAKTALVAYKPLPAVASAKARSIHDTKRRQLAAAVAAALAALQAARTALRKAMGEAVAAAESPAQQTLPIVQKELEQAKQDTVTETKAAVEAGVPPAALPPPSTPLEKATDATSSEVSKEAIAVVEKTTQVAENADSSDADAALDAGAPPAPSSDLDEASPPTAVIEDAAKQAQDAVNEAVGAKQGSVLPILAAVGIAAALLFMRKKG